MREFDTANPVPPGGQPETEGRRWFEPNMGAWNANGTGSLEDPFELYRGDDPRAPLLPEEEFGYYDGWVEHDDLAAIVDRDIFRLEVTVNDAA